MTVLNLTLFSRQLCCFPSYIHTRRFNPMRFHTVQHSAIQRITMPLDMMQMNVMQYNAVRNRAFDLISLVLLKQTENHKTTKKVQFLLICFSSTVTHYASQLCTYAFIYLAFPQTGLSQVSVVQKQRH